MILYVYVKPKFKHLIIREKSVVKIHMFQSGYGDSFLVKLEQHDNSSINLVIDLGFCFSTIASKMEKILNGEEIHRFIITHFDSDHIQGAAKLISENGYYEKQSRFNIRQVWMNSYRHLNAIQRGKTFDSRKLDAYKAEQSYISENTEHSISALQASTLAADLYKYGYCWNQDASGQAICIENLNTQLLSKSTKITLLTPTEERLVDLEHNFVTDLSKLNLHPTKDAVFDDAFELFNLKSEAEPELNESAISSSQVEINKESIQELSRNEGYIADDRPANGSSISFILEHKGKRMLFLADAFAEDVVSSLKHIYANSVKPLYFDAIKVSHHGSLRNNSLELFELVDSSRYLFSTNGKHPSHTHPDLEVISCIINRPLLEEKPVRTLYFNYELTHLEGFNRQELKAEFKYEIVTEAELIEF